MAKLREMKPGAGDELLLEYDQSREGQVAEAERLFNLSVYGAERRESGSPSPRKLAFAQYGPGRQKLIREFDRSAPEIVIMPLVTGG